MSGVFIQFDAKNIGPITEILDNIYTSLAFFFPLPGNCHAQPRSASWAQSGFLSFSPTLNETHLYPTPTFLSPF